MALTPEQKVNDEIGDLLERLQALGFRVSAVKCYEGFGDFYVDLVRGSEAFRILRDRGQFCIDADRDELQRFNLWRAFDEKEEFTQALLTWLARRHRDEPELPLT